MTLLLIAITSLISILAFNQTELFNKLKFNAYMVYHKKEWYRLFSHGLIHADWNHLIFNMLSFYFFGEVVERYFRVVFGAKGIFLFVLLYVLAIIVASLRSLYQHKNNHWYNSVGASGGVAAIIFACILFDPHVGIYIFFIPIPIPGYVFGPLYLLYSHYMSKKNIDNIGHDAHFIGAVFGFLFPLLIEYKLIYLFLDRLIQ